MYIKILMCQAIFGMVSGVWDCMCLTKSRVEDGFGKDWKREDVTDSELDNLRIPETLLRCIHERFKFILLIDVVTLIAIKIL